MSDDDESKTSNQNVDSNVNDINQQIDETTDSDQYGNYNFKAYMISNNNKIKLLN